MPVGKENGKANNLHLLFLCSSIRKANFLAGRRVHFVRS